MAKYQIKSPLKVLDAVGNGFIQTEGEVELSAKDASELLARDLVGEIVIQTLVPAAAGPTDETERLAEIQNSIGLLDTTNSDLWLKDGRPNTAAIIAIVGWNVTAAERDAAWSALQVK